MMKTILILFFAFSFQNVFGQEIPVPAPPKPRLEIQPQSEIVEFPDAEAQFPGGMVELRKFINENLEYPQIAIEQGDQGKVFVSFIVKADGTLENIQIERGVTAELDAEAKRLIRKMPNWIPGEKGGQPVETRFRIPIVFYLD